jgi:hypothetical protein
MRAVETSLTRIQRQRSRPCFQKQFYVTIPVQITYTRSSTRRLTHIPIQMCAQQLAKACVTGISADVENSERQMTNFYLRLQPREEHGSTIEMSESQIKHSMQCDHENHDTESTWQNS